MLAVRYGKKNPMKWHSWCFRSTSDYANCCNQPQQCKFFSFFKIAVVSIENNLTKQVNMQIRCNKMQSESSTFMFMGIWIAWYFLVDKACNHNTQVLVNVSTGICFYQLAKTVLRLTTMITFHLYVLLNSNQSESLVQPEVLSLAKHKCVFSDLNKTGQWREISQTVAEPRQASFIWATALAKLIWQDADISAFTRDSELTLLPDTVAFGGAVYVVGNLPRYVEVK